MTQDMNPYRPPQSAVLHAEDSGAQFEIAGKWRRFGTLAVDMIVRMLTWTLPTTLLFAPPADPDIAWALSRMGISMAWIVAYYLVFEGLWGRTPGKWVCGTRVVDEDGRKPAFGTVVKRTLCRFIPFEPFSFLGERGWHDSISKTRVIRAR
jgi:uncharacterized RDD family membrane protein YckC